MTALHVRITEFRFTHNFIICDRLPNTEIIFCIDVQKKFSLPYAWNKEKNCYIQKDGTFLTYTQNCKQKVTIWIVKSTLMIPPRHNSVVLIKIKGHPIMGHTSCFISDQESTKGKDPKINIMNGIHNIKGKTSANILVSNYNKHVSFNKGEYLGHLKNIAEEENPHPHEHHAHTTSSVTAKNDVRTSGTRWFWTTMAQTPTKYWGQAWSTFWRNMNYNSWEMKLPLVQHY